MDVATLVLSVIVLATLGGVGAVAARGAGWWTPPALPEWVAGQRRRERWNPGRPASAAEPESAPSDGRGGIGEPVPESVPANTFVPVVVMPETVAMAAPPATGSPPSAVDPDVAAELRSLGETLREAVGDGWRDELRAATAARDERLTRWEQRFDAQVDRLARGLDERVDRLAGAVDEQGRTAEARREAMVAAMTAAEARQQATLERWRADLLAALAERDATAAAREAGAARTRTGARRAATTAELYARLARLESAVAAVTNPILLPGEPYAPPAEVPVEALAWENWKDVGERAFAFADYANAERLQLAPPVGVEVASFVATLRGLLTSSIYPNLRVDPFPPQRQALRAALDQLAVEFPRLRRCLEAAFRAEAGSTDDGVDDLA